MKKFIIHAIENAVKDLYSMDSVSFSVDFPNELKFGDYATNVALVISKEVKRNPHELADEISAHIKVHANTDFSKAVSSVNVVGGFINFTLSPTYLWNFVLEKQIKTKKEGIESKKILVEYGDPNTHKLPHIGHLFSYIVGDSFARLLDAVGHTVMKANYQGDVGPHVAKSIYGYIQVGQPKPSDALEKVQLLQKCYQEGSNAYEEDPIAKETIDDINKKIYSKDPEIIAIWKETRQWSVDYYHLFEEQLGIHQTYHYWESDIWERGKKIVKDNIGKVFELSDGAVVFVGEKFGLHTRVFLTKNDTPTYEAKDLGLNIQKFEDWPYDTNLITTANEQNAYFDVMIKALELCSPELVGKVKHVGFGMVSLSTGKMSSRTGEILSAIDLITAVKERVIEVMKTREGMTEQEKESIANTVTLGAVKFAFLKQNILQNMKFDIEESVSFDGRSGPYIQYTYARIQSILKQVSLPDATSKDGATLQMIEEQMLMRWLTKFPTVVQQAAEALAPHLVAEYIYQTAQIFNTFYANCPINTEKDEDLRRARRTLAIKTASIIKQGLTLIGIDVVNKM